MLHLQCKMLLVLLFFQFAVVKAQGPPPPPPPANVKENRLMGLEGKMKLIAEKATTRNGHAALYLELEYLQTKRLRELDVINGRRHYTVLVITFSNHGATVMGSENAYERIANSFLGSFQIVEASHLARSVR